MQQEGAEPKSEEKKDEKVTTIKLQGTKQCPTKGVTVYSDRAEITRLVSFEALGEGDHSIIVEGLSTYIDEASIHVSGGVGEATILEVSYRRRFEPIKRDESESAKISQQIEAIDEQIRQEESSAVRIKKEVDWLADWATRMSTTGSAATHKDENNKSHAIQNPFSDSHFEQTEKFLEFYDRMMAKNDAKAASTAKTIKKLQEKRRETQNLLHGHVAPAQEKREVIISIHVAKPGLIELSLSYVVNNASWVANYDLRVSSETGTQLIYYGTIHNNTNEEWINASLSLSTASPASGGSPPELATVHVEFDEDYSAPVSRSRSSRAGGGGGGGGGGVATNPLYSQPVHTNALYSQQTAFSQSDFGVGGSREPPKAKSVAVLTADSSEGVGSANFTIPRPADIPADGQPHKVTIAMMSLTSRFTNVVVPKKTSHSYLKATITNTSQLPFLAGEANVFMDMNFVALSRIEYVPAGENFAMYLGVDNSVRVDRKADKKQNETASYILSKASVRTMRHETIVKNAKNAEVALVFYEQLPLSNDEKIKVKLVTPQLTETDKDSKPKSTDEKAPMVKIHINHDNILEWRSLVPAKSEVSFVVEYTIEWPKDKTVHIN